MTQASSIGYSVLIGDWKFKIMNIFFLPSVYESVENPQIFSRHDIKLSKWPFLSRVIKLTCLVATKHILISILVPGSEETNKGYTM